MPAAQLLRLRFCDLPVSLENAPVRRLAECVFQELEQNGLIARPSIWLSEEWFNPDGVTGFAIPFYLAHPRLIRLERQMMLEAEGAAKWECLKILRHETGHAIDEAYQLYKRDDYAEVFGSPWKEYPASYQAEPLSREHVIHLNNWYAQAHPVEDFAETFAVWLKHRRRRWRSLYRGWPALEKLRAVDRWMQEWAGRPPVSADLNPVEPLSQIDRTIGQHYEEKRSFYGVGAPSQYDRQLRHLFASASASPGKSSAAAFIRALRNRVRNEAARPLGVPAYVADQVVRQLIHRAKALDLRHARPSAEVAEELSLFVSRATIALVRSAPRLPL